MTAHVNHYLESLQALERGATEIALVHATLAGHAAVAEAIANSSGVYGQPVYPAIIRTGATS